MLDYDWSDLDLAPLPVFDSESDSELIDDDSDTIFECKKQSLEYSECLLYEDLHWLNDLDELDKILDNYKDTQSTESTEVIIQQINNQNSIDQGLDNLIPLSQISNSLKTFWWDHFNQLSLIEQQMYRKEYNNQIQIN